MNKISTLKQIYTELGCRERVSQGICWFECNMMAERLVVIFPGVTGGKIDMMPLAQHYVSAGYAVCVFDLPGHGGSVRTHFKTYDDLAKWLLCALDQLGKTPHLIIGNSFSSSVLYHALRMGWLPSQIKVALACPTPTMSRIANTLQRLSNKLPDKLGWDVYTSKSAQGIRMVVGLKTRRKDAWQWLRESERYKRNTLTLRDSDILTTLLYNQNPYIFGMPEEAQQRITVIIGDKDNIINAKAVEIMHELLPRGRFVTAPGAGHLLHLEAIEYYPTEAENRKEASYQAKVH
jgi:hypothetical protein cdivTM_08834